MCISSFIDMNSELKLRAVDKSSIASCFAFKGTCFSQFVKTHSLPQKVLMKQNVILFVIYNSKSNIFSGKSSVSE